MAQKLLVTHSSPDLDALTSLWLFRRFDAGNFADAAIAFVPAGEQITLEQLGQLGFTSYDVTHVDTGGGEFDHHTPEQARQNICAASLVYDHLCKEFPDLATDAALKKLVQHVIEVDHFAQSGWPERLEVRTYFCLSTILQNLKSIGLTDEGVIEYGMTSLDAIHSHLKKVVAGSEELKTARVLETKWGRAALLLSKNPEVEDLALKSEFSLVVRKDPEYGHIRILGLPQKDIDLTPIYEKIQLLDQSATWYLHPGKTMLLNGSDKRRLQAASRLNLDQVEQLLSN